jgi:hypothetical protein
MHLVSAEPALRHSSVTLRTLALIKPVFRVTDLAQFGPVGDLARDGVYRQVLTGGGGGG